MPDHQVEQESHRLGTLYAQMTDEQLQELAKDRSSLTDPAGQMLSAEMARREIPPSEEAAPPPESPDIELLDLVILRQFRDLPDATLARGILEAAGIETFFADDNIVRMDWFISNAVGGIKLKVKREDLEAANLILETSSVSTDDDLDEI
jgi:hypothetical protein